MPIDCKPAISDPKTSKKRVSAVDSEKLIAALNKLGDWATYTPALDATPKFDKAKKVESVTLKVTSTATLPDWAEYSKTTKARKDEWDTMITAAEKYLDSHHKTLKKAVDDFAKDLKSQDLDKAGWEKHWKSKKAEILKVSTDYAKGSSNGGLTIAIIGPDPIEVKTDIKAPSSASYTVGGKTIKEVYGELAKRAFWGRYRSNGSFSAEFAIDAKVSKVTVKAAPVITMPSWSGYNKATKEQKANWDTMWATLNKHENNHHNIFVKAVEQFAKDIKNEDLDSSGMTTYWADKTKDWQGLQDDYDSKTSHGVKEGVALDSSVDP